jgi:hypothetical protein
MSHFVVLVVGANSEEEVDKALYPYWELDLSQEDMLTDPRAEFCVKIPEGEVQKAWREWKKQCPTRKDCAYAHRHFLRPKPQLTPLDKLTVNNKTESINREEFDKWCDERGYHSYMVKEKIFKDKYPTVEAWIEGRHSYSYREGEGYGYYHNPNAKWDWFQIGGRWAGYFRLKEGKSANGKKGQPTLLMDRGKAAEILAEPLTCDIARKGDIDFEGMVLENKADAEKTWKKHLQKIAKKDNNYHPYFEHGIESEDTKSKFIRRRTSIATFAVLMNGIWYQRGQMGWWGCVADEKDQDEWIAQFDKLLKGLSDDTWLAAVDCHI